MKDKHIQIIFHLFKIRSHQVLQYKVVEAISGVANTEKVCEAHWGPRRPHKHKDPTFWF